MIGERLEEVRNVLVLNKKEFSSSISITQQAYNRYFQNKRLLPTNTTLLINQLFNVSTDWLLTGSGEMFNNTVNITHAPHHIPSNVVKHILQHPTFERVARQGETAYKIDRFVDVYNQFSIDVKSYSEDMQVDDIVDLSVLKVEIALQEYMLNSLRAVYEKDQKLGTKDTIETYEIKKSKLQAELQKMQLPFKALLKQQNPKPHPKHSEKSLND